MANSIGNLNVSVFGDSALKALEDMFPFANVFATDISTITQPYGYGSSITVKTFANVAAGTYSTTNGYLSQTGSATDTVVTINNHKFQQFELNQQELTSPYAAITLAQYGERAGYAIAQQMTSDLISVVTGSSYSYSTQFTNSGSFSRSSLVNAGTLLSKRGVSKQGRVAVLSNDYYNYLGNDSSIVAQYAYNTDFVKTGVVPPLAGFDIYEVGTGELPSANNVTFSGSVNLVGFAAHPSAIAFVSRIPQPIDPGLAVAETAVSVSERLGLAVYSTKYFDLNKGSYKLRTELMYGFAVGNPSALQAFVQ